MSVIQAVRDMTTSWLSLTLAVTHVGCHSHWRLRLRLRLRLRFESLGSRGHG
jgi:hypothetical protein